MWREKGIYGAKEEAGNEIKRVQYKVRSTVGGEAGEVRASIGGRIGRSMVQSIASRFC